MKHLRNYLGTKTIDFVDTKLVVEHKGVKYHYDDTLTSVLKRGGEKEVDGNCFYKDISWLRVKCRRTKKVFIYA
jgi:hypothetical protein